MITSSISSTLGPRTQSAPATNTHLSTTWTAHNNLGATGSQLLEAAVAERTRQHAPQSTAGASISPRIGREARTAISEGKFLPLHYYFGRPPHQATDFLPEQRTKLAQTVDGDVMSLVTTASSASNLSNKPLPIDSEWRFTLGVFNWFGAVASLRPDLTKDALELTHTTMQFLDKYRCWQSAFHYFDGIRRNRAVDGNEEGVPLGERDGAFLTECGLLSLRKKQGFQLYGGDSTATTTNNKKESCIQWNKGKCKRTPAECRYAHRCSICTGSHPAIDCDKKPAAKGDKKSPAPDGQ